MKKPMNLRKIKYNFVLLIILVILIILINFVSIISAEDISLSMSWNEEDIINGEEFEINIAASNLLEKDYDVKVFISNEENKIISQTYNDEKWVTSNNYIKGLFTGPGEDSDKINLRINKNYQDFEGNAKIGIRIRESGKTSYKQDSKDIEIIKSNEKGGGEEEDENGKNEGEGEGESKSDNSIKRETIIYKAEDLRDTTETKEATENITKLNISENQETIRLGKIRTEDIKTQNSIVYESENELIKKYSVYGFAFLCIILIILLVFKKI